MVENDPEETFGPVKQQTRAQPAPEPAQSKRDTVGFGDESDEEYETDANGKRGARSKLKGKLGARREQHHEKKREKADHQLEHKMQEKELSKTNAVTVSQVNMISSSSNCLCLCLHGNFLIQQVYIVHRPPLCWLK